MGNAFVYPRQSKSEKCFLFQFLQKGLGTKHFYSFLLVIFYHLLTATENKWTFLLIHRKVVKVHGTIRFDGQSERKYSKVSLENFH